ncbi:MAG: Lrp/AsnC family transcriptional regulator [Candidatus Moduliflexus flocculans]|nr:Lrp/AsnC family transcriptional regulator [Candidatus Moduliflexus flocculans]
MRRLEERGLIRGYRAVLDPQGLGYHAQAVVMINLTGHQAKSIDLFEAQVRALLEVKLCLNVTGRYDYLLHVVVRDIEHLRRLVSHELAAIGGVQKQETFLVLATAKEDQGLALRAERAGRRAAPPDPNVENLEPGGLSHAGHEPSAGVARYVVAAERAAARHAADRAAMRRCRFDTIAVHGLYTVAGGARRQPGRRSSSRSS